jgi:DNA invertase Pin-like site-specific DNA recombinase
MNEMAPPLPNTQIHPHHRDRMVIVYVRQSTPQQTSRHPESTRLQYGLVHRAIALGWVQTQVHVIDDDLGKSGSSAQGRAGFQRLVSEVTLGHVGLVLGIEMSRLARSCRDWYQLLEVCGLFATLIGDEDGVYDPADYNDRLLLGLKGTMSEAELHLLKQRMLAGKRAKAERGELGMLLPRGYMRHASGAIIKDPDEQVQTTIALLFEQFERLGTLNGVLQYLVQHHILLPQRLRSGLCKGDLEWRRPNRGTLANLFHNPLYAGAYAYGRHPLDPKRRQPGYPGRGKRVAAPGQWAVLRKDQLPGYISWEQFERNVRQLRNNNNAHGMGAIRQGASLLSGLLVCGHCGKRMMSIYRNNGQALRYDCNQAAVSYGEARCQSLKGEVLDEFVTQQVLRALEPAALEISLRVIEDVETGRAREQQLWQQRLQRAHYEVERAARQYHAVEPEHRLVARPLERDWEQALGAQGALHADYERFLAEQPARLDAAQREQVRQLASDIPALWHAATSTGQERQAIMRCMIERITVTVRGSSEQVDVRIEWIGHHETTATITRPIAREDQLSYYPRLRQRITELHQQEYAATAIAGVLNAEGWRPAKRRPTFNGAMVSNCLRRLGLHGRARQIKSVQGERLADEWLLEELARELDMPLSTLYRWLYRGQLRGRKVDHHGHARWLIAASADELARLRSLRQGHSSRAPVQPTSIVSSEVV